MCPRSRCATCTQSATFARGRTSRRVHRRHHGDVDVTLHLFTEVIQCVAFDRDSGKWRWIAPPGTVVVVLGDVVDRSRGIPGDTAENRTQWVLPDDLYVLHPGWIGCTLLSTAQPLGGAGQHIG